MTATVNDKNITFYFFINKIRRDLQNKKEHWIGEMVGEQIAMTAEKIAIQSNRHESLS